MNDLTMVDFTFGTLYYTIAVLRKQNIIFLTSITVFNLNENRKNNVNSINININIG